MIVKTLRYCAILALGFGVAAQASQQAPAAAPPNDLMDFTCGQYLQSVRIADPGAEPSAQRKEQAVAAQDALADAMLWVHGYTSGRSGRAPEPLTRQWMVDMVGSVAKACRASSLDGSMRVADVVAKM